jgi:uncharacterized integral membrane protein
VPPADGASAAHRRAAFDAGAVATLLPEDAQRCAVLRGRTRPGLPVTRPCFAADASRRVRASRSALLDPAWFAGAAGLGGSLFLVHMYVTPIKRTMQALWAAGLLGSLALAATQDGTPVAAAVYAHKEFVWAVGPLFAAFTGLCFKEGACYGKAESAALFFLWPTLLLGHLAGAPDVLKAPLLAAAVGLITLFAARKFTQAVKDDIGDRSIFDFQALSPLEQEAREAELAAAVWNGSAAQARDEADQ